MWTLQFLNQPKNSTSQSPWAMKWVIMPGSRILLNPKNTKNLNKGSSTQRPGLFRSRKGAQRIRLYLTMKRWMLIMKIYKPWLRQSKLGCKKTLVSCSLGAYSQRWIKKYKKMKKFFENWSRITSMMRLRRDLPSWRIETWPGIWSQK